MPSATVDRHQNNQIALLCTLHASSTSAKQKVTDLLSTGREYYTTGKAQCTTWCYFTPSTRPKAPSQLISKDEKETVVAGFEIYSDKQALSTQQNEDWFKNFQKTVKEEKLFNERGEEQVAWYPTAGFVAREDAAPPYGGIVMLAVFTCKEGKRDEVVKVVGSYTEFVRENEPGVLTYCTMVRPKAPNQILLFERYQNSKALGAHGTTKEFKAMFKGIAPHIEVKQTKLQQFEEFDNAFVSNVIGGGRHEVAVAAKL
ncbi:hypothetical protein LTR64_005873 [Lithohypha guttulata]|uniref:uncharacterized protein n=1 Tax=Lithohypha guttulata TaxID=1690604 RepID=UPI002DE099A1|nr:hypothetical protein LTR51_002332 [Lithohypha guttulata]